MELRFLMPKNFGIFAVDNCWFCCNIVLGDEIEGKNSIFAANAAVNP